MAETITVGNNTTARTVGDPTPKYDSLRVTWDRARAIMNGQNRARDFDKLLDTVNYTNLLLPFSPSMDQQQYAFYVAESELPGLVSQYAKVLISGLLRKLPIIVLPKSAPEEAHTWLMNSFGADNTSITSVLDATLWEEMQTSRAWLMVDHPYVDPAVEHTQEELDKLSPYTKLIMAENIINWQVKSNKLTRLIVRNYEENYDKGEWHPEMVDTVTDYHLDAAGKFCIQKYIRERANDNPSVVDGAVKSVYKSASDKWVESGGLIYPLVQNEKFDFIPARPLNGSYEPVEPFMQTLVDREIALYNKMSRRNHLLYGAATYTPYIAGDLSADEAKTAVSGGLGSWLFLPKDTDVGVMDTPTDALSDMEAAISAAIGEMARLGIRMLTPDNAPQESGVALEIKNAAQTSQLGLLNRKASKTLEFLVSVMLFWKYGVPMEDSDKELECTLSEDFNPTPLGADWMRLITEWYQSGVIPRSVFLDIAKKNDIISADYDDEAGQTEIKKDDLLNLGSDGIDSSLLEDLNGSPPAKGKSK